jgi:hypothetical protein
MEFIPPLWDHLSCFPEEALAKIVKIYVQMVSRGKQGLILEQKVCIMKSEAGSRKSEVRSLKTEDYAISSTLYAQRSTLYAQQQG